MRFPSRRLFHTIQQQQINNKHQVKSATYTISEAWFQNFVSSFDFDFDTTQLNSTGHLKVATRGKKLIAYIYLYPRFLNIQSI